MNPIDKFNEWYSNEVEHSSTKIPSACCLTSIGLDGYPNSRFVSLKEILDDNFVITGPLNSKKGKELIKNPKAALTFWWPETQRQVRIQGNAKRIEDNLANHYFKNRNKESKLVSLISNQGEEILNLKGFIKLFKNQKILYEKSEVTRPDDWSGFYIVPKRIELMEFKESRFHLRELYTIDDGQWKKVYLQP